MAPPGRFVSVGEMQSWCVCPRPLGAQDTAPEGREKGCYQFSLHHHFPCRMWWSVRLLKSNLAGLPGHSKRQISHLGELYTLFKQFVSKIYNFQGIKSEVGLPLQLLHRAPQMSRAVPLVTVALQVIRGNVTMERATVHSC